VIYPLVELPVVKLYNIIYNYPEVLRG